MSTTLTTPARNSVVTPAAASPRLAATPESPENPLQAKFAETQEALSNSLIERDEEIQLLMVALLCGEHVLLVGEPGTAKSMLSDAFADWLNGSRFSVLLTKFTTPEEVFGPISVQGLKNDIYRRITTGKAAEAEVFFADEIFKASSAILNTMLQLLNERTYFDGSKQIDCPLNLCIGASNEWPDPNQGGKELSALFDRFLFRKTVRPISSSAGMSRLLWDANLTIKLPGKLSASELEAAQAEVAAMPFSKPAAASLEKIIHSLKHEQITPGDRRLRKSVRACQALAWLWGDAQVESHHLEILSHVLWCEPGEQAKSAAKIIGGIANPEAMEVRSLLVESEQICAALDYESLTSMTGGTKKLKEVGKRLRTIGTPAAIEAARAVAARLQEVSAKYVEAIQ